MTDLVADDRGRHINLRRTAASGRDSPFNLPFKPFVLK